MKSASLKIDWLTLSHEVQNNAWDYHPLEDVEGPYDDLLGTNIKVPEQDEVDGKDNLFSV